MASQMRDFRSMTVRKSHSLPTQGSPRTLFPENPCGVLWNACSGRCCLGLQRIVHHISVCPGKIKTLPGIESRIWGHARERPPRGMPSSHSTPSPSGPVGPLCMSVSLFASGTLEGSVDCSRQGRGVLCEGSFRSWRRKLLLFTHQPLHLWSGKGAISVLWAYPHGVRHPPSAAGQKAFKSHFQSGFV